MTRTIHGAMILAVAAFVMIGCGKEIPADLTKAWEEKEGGVMTQLTAAKSAFDDLMKQFQSLPKDSTKAAEMTAIESELKGHESGIGDIEKMLNDLKTQKDSLVAAGKVGDFQALWETAQKTYEEIGPKIAAITTALGPVGEKIKGLMSGATATAAPATTGDSAATATVSATDAKVDAKDASVKADVKDATAKEGEKTESEKKDGEKTESGK